MSNVQTNIIQPFKIIFHHTECDKEFFEIENSKGELRRYTRGQVEALKKLMRNYQFQTIVFKDYSRVRV